MASGERRRREGRGPRQRWARSGSSPASWRWQLAAGAGLPAAAGGVAGWLLPRGPATSAQALGMLGGALALGLLVGTATRTRWAMVGTPLAFAVAFELARAPAVGPTVDGIHLGTPFGVLALLLGRGVLALLAVVPMLVGIQLGVSYATRRRTPAGRGARLGRRRGRVASLIGVAVVAALAVALVLPASTPPIVGPDGAPLPGSLAALEPVTLGGRQQSILVRGRSRDAPVLLYLAGGPGQSDLPYARVLLSDLERDFVVVSWDQRGAGRSYRALEPSADLTLERAVSDTVELSERLRDRFGERRIYLLGESWGSILAVLAAQRRPDLYAAVIGSGQMVSPRETDRRLYREALAYAAAQGDERLARTLRSYGEPPYDGVYAYGTVMGLYDALAGPYTPPAAYLRRGRAAGLGFMGVMGREYDAIDKVNVLRGLLDVFAILYPQLQSIDFRSDVPRLEVPYYLFDGGHELAARRVLALAWYDRLDAPVKRRFTFDNAGHSVAFEHFQDLHRILLETVLPETYRGG